MADDTPDGGERPSDMIGGTRFAIVPEWIIDEPGDVVKLYAILDRHANKDRLVWPGQAELAERMGCSDRQVRRHLTRLRTIGALETVKRRYNGTTLYVLRKDKPGLSGPDRLDTGVLTDRTVVSGLSGLERPPNESHLTRAKEPDAVDTVFRAWLESTKRTARTVKDSRRSRLITAALKTHPLADVLDAVRGWENSPYHRGENPSATVYNDLGLLLRDAEHIERFRDLARGPTRAPAKTNGQPVATHFTHMESEEAWRAHQETSRW